MKSRVLSALALAAALLVAAPPAQAQVDPAGCTDDLQYDASIPKYNEVLGTALGVAEHGKHGAAGRRSSCRPTSARSSPPRRTTRACG